VIESGRSLAVSLLVSPKKRQRPFSRSRIWVVRATLPHWLRPTPPRTKL